MKDTLSNRPANRPDRAMVGKIGEDTACKYLEKHGFKIVERNYWKKWGEIDIVAIKDKILHFVEVKSISRGRSASGGGTASYDPDFSSYDAIDNVHPWKVKRLSRAIQTYLLERKVDDEQDWQVDVITIELDFDSRNALVSMLEDVSI